MNQKAKILIVEDERIVAEDVRKSLNSLGYHVTGISPSAKDALEQIAKEPPDLVLMDIVLQGQGDGIDAASQIRQQYRIPVVFLTAYSDPKTLERAKVTEPYGYLLKPFEGSELRTTIEIVLHRHRMEIRLREREEWFSTTLKSIGDGVITADLYGDITFLNAAAEKICGWKSSDAIGRPFEQVFRTVDEKTLKPLKDLFVFSESGPAFNRPLHPIALLTRNDETIPVEINFSPIQAGEKDRILGSVLVFMDIQKQRLAEEALQHRMAFEEMLTKISTQFINLPVDAIEKEFRTALAEVGRFTGVDRCYVFEFTPDKALVNCTFEWTAKGVSSTLRTSRNLPAELFSISLPKILAGEIFYIPSRKAMEPYSGSEKQRWLDLGIQSLLSVPMRKGEDTVGFLGFHSVSKENIWSEDIIALQQVLAEIFINALERRKTENDLISAEAEKNLILSSISELVTYLDRDKRIIWVNRQVLDALGRDPEQIIGMPCHEVFREGAEMHGCVVERCLKEQEAVEGEIQTPDGRFWIIRGNPVRDLKGAVIGAVEVRWDITRQKKMEEEKRAIQAQLQQSQKLEAIGTLTGGVAHDFNNLLTAILGCAEMALLKSEKESPVHHEILEIQSAASRAAELTRKLLLFGRKHPARIVSLDFNRIIDDMLKLLHRLIGENIGINTALEPGLWTIRADTGNMEQVLLNLVLNARDAMPRGGKVTIRTENVMVPESRRKMVPDAQAGPHVLISVIDTGTGMSRETMDRLFEPFFTTKGPGKGTGLGLPVVYGIIKQHQGWIEVASTPGQGSSFSIFLPATLETSEEQKPDRQALKKMKGGGEHILIVEDSDGVREFAKMALSENGYSVTAVANSEEAMALLKKKPGRFKMLFCDVVLPDQSDLDLYGQLKPRHPNLKILLTSGYSEGKSQWPEIQKRGFEYLQKPYTLMQLLAAVQQTLNQKSQPD
jgi:PAS domain S-box-containing protein